MHSHELISYYQAIPSTLKDSLVGTNYRLPNFEDPGLESLTGFRVALVTSHGPELPEFHVPLHYLRDRGASVEVVTPDWLFDYQEGEASGRVVLAQFLATKVCAKADKKISDAHIEDYDAVILIGGAWNPIMLRTDEKILAFIRDAHERSLLIAAICHGPQVLINAKTFPKGTRATGVFDIRFDLANAGFEVDLKAGENDPHVVFDESNKLITSPNPKPEALKAFCEEIGKYAHTLLSGRA